MAVSNGRRDFLVGRHLIWCIFIIGMFSTSGVAQIQPGSTGGTIGKQDKSISGSEEQSERRGPASAKSKRRANGESNSAGALPGSIRLIEHTTADYSITLTKTDGNTYNGTWSNGYGSTFTVTDFTKDSLNMVRQDGAATTGVSGTYTGRRSGNSAKGRATLSHGYGVRTWDATWP
jgi:hypothetical protein